MAWDCRARVTSFLVVHVLCLLACSSAFEIKWQWSDVPATTTPDDVVVPVELSTYANIAQIAIRNPVLGPDSLIWCSTLGDVWAVTNLTGRQPQFLWQNALATAVWGGARYGLRPGSPGGVVVVVDVTATARVFDAEIGGSLWSAGVPGETSFTSPYLLGGSVFIATYNGTVQAHSIADGQVLWTTRLGGAVMADMWSDSMDTLYVLTTDGTLFALNSTTGAGLWSLPLGAPSTFYSQIALQGSSIYVSLDGMLVCVDTPSDAPVVVSWSVPHAPGSVSITFLQLIPGSELLFAIHPQGFFMEVRLSDHAVLASDDIFTNYPSLTPSSPVVLNTANASCPYVANAPPPPPLSQSSDQSASPLAPPWSLSVYAADGRGTVRDLTAGDANLEEGALAQVAHAGLVWRDGLVFGVSHSAQVVALSVPGCLLPDSLDVQAPSGPVAASLNATLSPPRASSGDLQVAWVVVVTAFAAIACVVLALAVRWVSRRKATHFKAALSSDSAAGMPDAYPPDMFLGAAPSPSTSTSESSDSTSDSSASSFRRVINLVPEQGVVHVYRSDVHPSWVMGTSEPDVANLDGFHKPRDPSVWEWALNAASDPPPDAKLAAPSSGSPDPALDSLGDTCFLPMMRTMSHHGPALDPNSFAFDATRPAAPPPSAPALVPHALSAAISADAAPAAPAAHTLEPVSSAAPSSSTSLEAAAAWPAYLPSDSDGLVPDQPQPGPAESGDSMPGEETGHDPISSTLTLFSPCSSDGSPRGSDGSHGAGPSAEPPQPGTRSPSAQPQRAHHDFLSPAQMLMYDEMEEPTETLNAQGQDDWSSSFGDFGELSSSLINGQLQRASTLPGRESLKVALSMEYEGAEVAARARGSSAPLRSPVPAEGGPDLQPVVRLNDVLVHDALQEAGHSEGPARFV